MDGLKYMPLAESQQLKDKLPCDGALLVVEITEHVFVPGAKRWKEIVDLEEHRRIVQLFLFVLGVCIDTMSSVCLETIVTTSFNGRISRDTRVLGYRLWVPLKWTKEVEVFGRAVTSSVSPIPADDSSNLYNKRRRIVKEEEEVEPVVHLRRVTSFHDLVRILRLYNGGRGNISQILPVGVERSGVDDWDDSEGRSSGAPRFTDFIDAHRHFSSEAFTLRLECVDMYTTQRMLSSYLVDNPDGTHSFFPHDSIRRSGLLRHFRCGPGGFFERSAKELLGYMLPSYTVSVEEAREKIERVNAAIGIRSDLTGLDLEQLQSDYVDPHEYSAIVVSDEDLVDGDIGQSSYHRIISQNYHIISSLHSSNTPRFENAAVLGHEELRRFMTRVVGDLKLMFTGRTNDGIPKVYPRLYKESNILLAEMTRPTDKPHVVMARRMFYARKRNHEFTGLSWLFIRDITGGRKCLNFMIQQQCVYTLLYNQHFSATLNSIEVSAFTILAGPSDTGKSWAMKEFTRGIANSLSRTEDSKSDQASTVDDSGDLMIVVQDEYKGTTDGTDNSDDRTKNEQSRISNGVCIRRRWNRNIRTGKAEVETAIGIERTGFVCGTNALQRIPPAILSRATVIPVVSGNSRVHRDRMMDQMGNGVAAAIYNDPKVQCKLKAWQLSSKVLSSTQIHYSALDAVGALPHLRQDCFQLFKLLRLQCLDKSDTETSRDTTDLLRMATSIHIRDHLSIWYCRGLGEHFAFDKSIEALWYAWSNYLRMEEVILAMVQLESTRSLGAYIEEVIMMLKGSILTEEGEFLDNDEYWITKYTKRSTVLRELKARLSRFGDGLCEKVWAMVERSCTNDTPNIKTESFGERGIEHILILKRWVSATMTPVELAIIRALRRITAMGLICYREFEQEKYFVMDTTIRKSFRSPEAVDAIQHPELAPFTHQTIRNGFRMLEHRFSDNEPMIVMPADAVNAADYVSGPGEGVERSVDGMRWKRRKKMFMVMMVHQSLLDGSTIREESEIDKFFRNLLLIAGGYTGKRIFTGIDPVNPGSVVTDNCIFIKKGDKVSIRIKNPHRQTKAEDSILFGDDDGDGSLDEMLASKRSDTIFDPEKEFIVFDDASEIEKRVAGFAHSRVPLDPTVEGVFKEAYERFR
jgi:hypothetical protein